MNDLAIIFLQNTKVHSCKYISYADNWKKKKTHEIRTIILGPPIIDQQQLGLKSKCLGEIAQLTID